MNLRLKLKLKRNRYSYPARSLRAGKPCHFRATRDLDRYHEGLLNSCIPSRRIAGLFAVIYWGHVSGKNGKIKTNYALAKVNRAKTSRHFNSVAVALRLSQAKTLIQRHRYGEAVVCLTDIPQLGFAFASKICAFISGDECGVIDSVIVRQHPEFGFQTRKGYVQNTPHNAAMYSKYCKYLHAEAHKLNRCGLRARWKDRDGSLHQWPSVDVERALYG